MQLLITRKRIDKILTVVLSIILAFGITMPVATFAATDPGLGTASTFSIIAQTAITGTGTISGDVGINSTGAGITALTDPDVGGIIYSTDGVAPGTTILPASVQSDLSAANSDMSGQPSTGSIGPALDGLTLTTGVYDIGAGRLNGGVLTLDGAGVYIFRASSDFVSSGSISFINGARPCDVFWQVTTLATINGSSFAGTIVAGTGVHFGAGVTLDGRALALGGDVTLQTTTISGPDCDAPASTGSSSSTGSINVVKVVINDNGQTKAISDFPLFVNGVPVTSGLVKNYPAPATYKITETPNANYTQSFSGDCDANGNLTLDSFESAACFITNDDIGAPIIVPPVPPIIDILKVPAPLSLPDGPGSVLYTYTLRNIGTVPVNTVQTLGDSCEPLVRQSGDINNNNILEVSETWVYTCTTNLTETHTNVVTATGWANGIMATDIAIATVIVGAPVVPPLINITKTPSPLTLSFGGGPVTYTKKVTNPGTETLSNVKVTDNKCASVSYVSGDMNSNSMLEPSETWTYTCTHTLTATTTNTATATGDANGLTARDFALVTVVVAGAVPALPSAGSSYGSSNALWYILASFGFLTMLSLVHFARRKQTV